MNEVQISETLTGLVAMVVVVSCRAFKKKRVGV